MNTNQPFAVGARVVDLHDNHGTVTGYVRDSIGVAWDKGGTSCAPISHGGLRPEPTAITYTDGARGTASLEQGKHGGTVMVLRRGFPVAAEVVGAVKVEQITETLLSALGVSEPFVLVLWVGQRS